MGPAEKRQPQGPPLWTVMALGLGSIAKAVSAHSLAPKIVAGATVALSAYLVWRHYKLRSRRTQSLTSAPDTNPGE